MSFVPGVLCGHSTDPRRPTGCTVVIAPHGAVGGVDVRGASPGTRETELLSPINAVQQVHAVLLAGGSAFGLDAAGGVMRWLEERGIGLQVGPARVPIVPAAILYDLYTGDGRLRPDAAAGYAACQAAGDAPLAEGNVGAGAGALVGKLFGFERSMKGGVGRASLTVNGISIGAIVAVNAVGDVIDPATGRVVAGARSADGTAMIGTTQAFLRGELPSELMAGASTTLGIVVTDAKLDKAGANKLAQMAHDGLARCISPLHTMLDGDTIFALATGVSGERANLTVLGTLAAEVVTLAVLRAVRAAVAIGDRWVPHIPAARDFA